MRPAAREENSGHRRLYRAVDYVSDKWIPCDRVLLKKINQRLQSAQDRQADVEQILDIIQSDVSIELFTRARVLTALAHEGVAVDEDLSIREFVIEGGLEFLRYIFEDQSLLETVHNLDDADDAQRLRLFEAISAAAAAQTLAPTFGLDQNEGYGGALVRHLGLLLIAWNYPSVYAQALRAQQSGAVLDTVFHEKLGFSPEMLTIELLHRWGLSRTVSRTMFGIGDGEGDRSSDGIRHLYRVSEMLARANLPEVYPDAKTDWESVGGEITSRLGAAGLEAIQNSVEAHLNHYRANLPDLFEPGLTLDPRLRIPLYARTQRALSNPYLSLCDERIRGAFESLYAVLGATGDQQAILKEILREVIPRAGFQAGCIYTVNPERLELVPQTAIGTARRSDYSVQDVSLSHGSGGIVPLAYMSTQPIVEYAIKPNGDCVNLIAVSVGTQRRVGVILLEIEGHRYDLDAKSILSSVKAIQHALSQCLDSASN